MKRVIHLLLLTLSMTASATDISQTPLSTSSVNPNIIIGYDDSGSMGWTYLPDSISNSSLKSDYHYNPLAYNPNRIYRPWVINVAVDNSLTRAPNGSLKTQTTYFSQGSTLYAGQSYKVDYNCKKYWKIYQYPSNKKFKSKSKCYAADNKTHVISSNYTVKYGQTWRGTSYGSYYIIEPKSSCPSCAAAYPCPNGFVCTDLPDNIQNGSHIRRLISYTSSADPGAQNYANWYKYHRTRQLTLASTLSEVIPDLNNVHMGLIRFNKSDSKTVDTSSNNMFDLNDHTSKTTLLNYIYSINPSGYTPTHSNFKKVGAAFSNSNIITHACQKNSAFILTDGFANGSLPSSISYNKSTYGSGYPYQTTHSKSLADIALAYYTKNPLPSLTPYEQVPVDKSCTPTSDNPLADCNSNLHINTYALTLGAPGYVYKPNGQGIFPLLPSSQSSSFWVNPTSNSKLDTPTQIDDLWHATINGRGLMFSASDPESLTNSIKSAFSNITQRSITQANIGFSSVNVTSNDNYIFVSSFDSSDWSGDVKAYTLDTSTGEVKNLVWSAASLLNNREEERTVILDSDIGWGGLDAKVQAYLLGDQTNEGTLYRPRNSILGDAVNATPVVKDGIVYQASNDGMLHAYNAMTGYEEWVYIPGSIVADLTALTDLSYTHEYFVDSTPVVASYNNNDDKLLIGGLGGGKFGYYAVDVTDPSNPEPKWEFTNVNGGATSIYTPRLIKTNDEQYPYVVVITSGYNNSGAQPGYFWIINPENGNIIKTITTPVSKTGGVGLGPTSAYVPSTDPDEKVAYLYTGDESGYIYKIDTREDISSWAISKFAYLGQPITAKIELQKTPTNNPILLVGTGKFLGETDKDDNSERGFYAIQDNQKDNLVITKSVLTELTASGGALQTRTISKSSECVQTWTSETSYGWYFDFPEAGERMITDPVVSLGLVSFTSNVIIPNSCSAASYAWTLDLNSEESDTCFAPLTINASSSSIPDLNKGVLLSEKYATSPAVIRLPNGKIIKQTQLVDGTIKQHDLGTISGAKSKIRSIREISKPIETY